MPLVRFVPSLLAGGFVGLALFLAAIPSQAPDASEVRDGDRRRGNRPSNLGDSLRSAETVSARPVPEGTAE